MNDNTTKGTITITFGECVENHAKMEMIGTQIPKGLSVDEITFAKQIFEMNGHLCELIDLHDYLPKNTNYADLNVEDACILIIRGATYRFDCDPDELLEEHLNYQWDKQALMYGRVVNKHARWNVCISDYSQEPNYVSGKGRVVNFNELYLTQKIRDQLPEYFGEKTKNLNAEGNYYYDSKKCGIGFHGDSERKIVIALRLGETMNLHYQWFLRNKPIGERCILELNHGDMYVMSNKAVGWDWKLSSKYTLRHAAGASKYTTITEKPKKEKKNKKI